MEIEEVYVSFEIAKLLKEKGFNWDCITYYIDSKPNNVQYSMLFENNTTWEERCCSCPTLQMAMKWLREVHNLSVEVYRTACGYVGCIVAIPSGTDIKFLEEDGDDLPSGQYTTWEKACEAALKYSLENLI